jgi:IclR family acetate operon transcriptional repressor
LGTRGGRPADLVFGGPEGQQLYITTARQSVALDTLASAPLSGRLLTLAV